MSVRVAVDFGTSSTCVVASVHGRDPQVVVIDGQPLMSSAVYAAADGTLFVGQEAERQAAVDPSRYEPNPKRRIDEGELLLGDSVLQVTDVVHAVLARAVAEARRIAGQAEVDLLVLTHPADWGAIRTRLLRQAAGRLAREVALVPEPVAAAVYHAATFAPSSRPDGRTVEYSGTPGDVLAVLDLGGGTVDVSVVRRSPEAARAAGGPPQRGGFQVLATRGDPGFGGADIDQTLLDHVGSLVSEADPQAWQQLVAGRELADRRRRRVLRQDVRGAKETLSRHAYTDVPLPPPFPDAHVTREDLERLIATPLGRVVELTSAAIADAGLRPKQLAAIFLVGGSSRIPMISRLAYERTGVVPTSLDQPETVVARGALRAVQIDPDRTGALPGTSIAGPHPEQQRTEVVRPTGQPDVRAHRGGPPAPSPGRGFPLPPPGSFPGRAAPAGQYGRAFGGGPAAYRPGTPGPVPSPPAVNPSSGAKNRRRPLLLIGTAVVVAALIAVGVVIFSSSGDSAAAGRTFRQYDFSLEAPADWIQTSDVVADRQVILRPQDVPTGDDLVAAEEHVLDYDATANPQRFQQDLRSTVNQRAGYSAFRPDVAYGGRTVLGYHQSKEDGAEVDWYVVVQGRLGVHVGCQYRDPALRQRVDAACTQIVRTLKIGN